MKKFCLLAGLCLLLSGCASVDTFETLGQVAHVPSQTSTARTMQVSLPESADAQCFDDENATLYECDGCSVMTQTLPAGDMDATVRTLCGFSRDKLTLMESTVDEFTRYEWVWTAAGEQGDVLCRAVVLDDGNYHYCLCAFAPSETGGRLQEQWTQMFRSMRLS